MSAVLLLMGLLALFYIVARGRVTIETKLKAKTQVEYVNLFLADDSQREWLSKCSSSEEVIENGKDQLWDAARIMRSKLLRLRESKFQIDPKDTSIIDSMIAVNKIILAMEMAQHNDIPFMESHIVIIGLDDDEPKGGDDGIAV